MLTFVNTAPKEQLHLVRRKRKVLEVYEGGFNLRYLKSVSTLLNLLSHFLNYFILSKKPCKRLKSRWLNTQSWFHRKKNCVKSSVGIFIVQDTRVPSILPFMAHTLHDSLEIVEIAVHFRYKFIVNNSKGI